MPVLRHLRHPALAFWTAFLVIALAGGIIVATHAPATAPRFDHTPALLPDQGARIFALEQMGATLGENATNPTTLASWSESTANMATNDATAYQAAGAAATNPLVLEYTAVATQARDMATTTPATLVTDERQFTSALDALIVGQPTAPPTLQNGSV